MTSDQERTIEALSLFHGGWAQAKEIDGWKILDESVYRVETAGDQPNYTVLPNGDVLGYPQRDGLTYFKMTAEEVQMAVYAIEGLAG